METLISICDYILSCPWLVPVPFVIFLVTPRVSPRLKSGRILFLWLLTAIFLGSISYQRFLSQEPYECCTSKLYYYGEDIVLFLWGCFLSNVYIGWWEFLWRCVYRQWSWPPLKNLQYGVVSNLSILGSAVFTLGLPGLILLLSLMYYLGL
jgi:hypothetical protein